MKKKWIAQWALVALCLSKVAFADPRIDLYPQSIKFRKGLDDDISMTYSQHVYIYVVNNGNVAFTNSKPIQVRIAGRIVNGLVYGPDDEGGSVGGPIGVGKTGKIFVHLPLNTLRHCQDVDVHIDTLRERQYGPSVFLNDQRRMKSQEIGSLIRCLDRPIVIPPRDPNLPMPHPPGP